MIASALDNQGLYTFPNPLAKVPVGALLVADNMVCNRDGILDSRRGLAAFGNSLNVTTPGFPGIMSIIPFQNRLIINASGIVDGSLFYDSDGNGNWAPFTGTWIGIVENESRIRYQEANKNMYFVSSNPNAGVFKLQAYNIQPTFAGGLPGLDGSGGLTGSGSGFLGSDFQCAYQIVFGYIDLNGNLILGNPSESILVVNSTGGSDNVTLTFTLPQGITTNWFYQIYRTPQTVYSATPADNVPPGAEPQLAAQQNITSGQVAALSVTYTDVTPDALLGAFLYTNPSQEGSLQTNDRPPFAFDICTFGQMMFYANCTTLYSLIFNMISVGSPNGVQIGDTITINGITFTAASSQNNASLNFAIVTTGTVATNIDATARNLVSCINANAASTGVYAFYISGYNSLPGQIELQATSFNSGGFSITSSRGAAYDPTIPASGTSFSASNDSTPNGIYVSKVAQPEAVPAVNLIFVGGGDQPIIRIVPLRDRVIVIKTDGIFVITGSTPDALTITLLDSTIICIAPDSVRLLNNSVYMLSQQGVVAITESGVTIQSRAIEGDLLFLAAQEYTHATFEQLTTATTYESERLYILAVPTNPDDQVATQQFCYNWITNAWTRWTLDFEFGLVNPFDNLLYVARPTTNNNFLYQERKSYTFSDYMDDIYPITITGVDTTGLIVSISTTPLTSWVGCGLEQDNVGVAIILAVDIVNNTLTVDIDNSTQAQNPILGTNEALLWVVGAAQVEVPIPLALTVCPQTAGFPHFMKDWGRVNFWFNSQNFNKINASWQTDLAGFQSPTQAIYSNSASNFGFGPYGSGPYGGQYNFPQAIQTLVPTDIAKSRWVMPSLSVAFPGCRLSYLGVTLSYDIISDEAG